MAPDSLSDAPCRGRCDTEKTRRRRCLGRRVPSQCSGPGGGGRSLDRRATPHSEAPSAPGRRRRRPGPPTARVPSQVTLLRYHQNREPPGPGAGRGAGRPAGPRVSDVTVWWTGPEPGRAGPGPGCRQCGRRAASVHRDGRLPVGPARRCGVSSSCSGPCIMISESSADGEFDSNAAGHFDCLLKQSKTQPGCRGSSCALLQVC